MPRGKQNDKPNYIPPGTKGAIGELRVCSDLLSKNFAVFRSVSPSSSCDLVALKNGICYRIEVTYATVYKRRDGEVRLLVKERDNSKYDILALIVDNEIVYTPSLSSLNA